VFGKEVKVKFVRLGAFLFALTGFAANQPAREMLSPAIIAGGLRVPEFSHGYVIVYQPESGPANSFTAFAPDGRLAFSKTIEVPGGTHVSLSTVDFDAEGNSAVAANALGAAGYLHSLLLFDAAGRQTGFVDTGRYVPLDVAIAPDHSIWTMGWMRGTGNPVMEDGQEYMVVRQFAPDGRQMGGFLPRYAFPARAEPAASPRIQVTKDRVGVLIGSGKSGNDKEWVELDLRGNAIDRVRFENDSGIIRIALTEDDHVYLQAHGYGDLFMLDRAAHAWKPVPNQASALVGADGNRLVYRKSGSGPMLLQWFDQP
jgi:hypothetical protein